MSDIMIEINAICEFDENRKDFLFQIIPIMEDLEGFVGKDANLEEVGQHIGAAIDRACVSYNKKLCQKDARIKELEDENGKLMAIFESVRNLDQYSAQEAINEICIKFQKARLDYEQFKIKDKE